MARKKGKGKKKGRVITVNFEGVSAGGGSRVPEGDYPVTVDKITEEEGKDSKKPYLLWELKITEGKHKGKKLFHRTSLQPQALFNLRATLEAGGVEVPESVQDIDLDSLDGMEFAVGVIREESDDGERSFSKVVDVFPLDELEEGEDEEEEGEDEEEEGEDEEEEDEEEDDEDEEDEDEEEQDYSEMDLSELKELAKERGIKVKKKAKKADLVKALEESDEEEEDI